MISSMSISWPLSEGNEHPVAWVWLFASLAVQICAERQGPFTNYL